MQLKASPQFEYFSRQSTPPYNSNQSAEMSALLIRKHAIPYFPQHRHVLECLSALTTSSYNLGPPTSLPGNNSPKQRSGGITGVSPGWSDKPPHFLLPLLITDSASSSIVSRFQRPFRHNAVSITDACASLPRR